MRNVRAENLNDSWNSLLNLLKDSMGLSPPAQFMLLCILHDFCKECSPSDRKDKKDVRDLHDITTRLIDAIASIAGSCLEQTTWLRRNLAVKEGATEEMRDGSLTPTSGTQQYSVEAQSILAHYLVNILDYAYGSLEKDKITQIVTTLMYNIIPYLKNHTVKNVPFFYACSNLLSTLTPYQYTRKAWRKDVFDLLMDPSFFQMDISCLPFWKQILDNLMSFDSITFRELMSESSLFRWEISTQTFRFRFSSTVGCTHRKPQHFHFERARVRAEGAAVEETRVCDLLQRERSVSEVHAGDPR
jgi:hypothetical protein